MTKKATKRAMAGLLTFAMAVTGSMTGGANLTGKLAGNAGKTTKAADTTEFTKVLGAEDIKIRYRYKDTSNIGEAHEVTLSDGSKITVKDNGSMREELSSKELADKEMGAGINLGNTLEAVQFIENKDKITDRTQYDQAWSQPVTTRAYIDEIHSYGINTLRIPVAWSNGDIDDGTYTIKGALLDRVEEVANYALDQGMYVIINDHWDNQWWGQFGACTKDAEGNKVVDEQTRKNAWVRYERYWTQIAERFKGYSDHLIFEGANEELGDRLNDAICINGPAKGYQKPDNAGKDIKTCGGNLNTDELYEMTNKINQKFVDIIRASGGNNANRHLLIPGYDTNISKTVDERYQMPKDTAQDKLFLSVHFYDPNDLCLNSGGGDYTEADQKANQESFAKLKKFSDAGYGIILGECAVCEPSATTSSVTQWFNDTFTYAQEVSAVPVLWDIGAYFDRTKPAMNYKDIAVFYNTINGVSGKTDMTRITGGATPAIKDDNGFTLPDYLDVNVWGKAGIHAYMFYQTSSWDYRNAYKAIRQLGNNAHAWEYIQATGSENTVDTKVTDVHITDNGTYTVSLDGVDLSGATGFKLLGISTDIDTQKYEDIKMTVEKIVIDGKELELATDKLIWKEDDPYYDFMAINVYDKVNEQKDFALGEANENELLKLPQKNMEITFTISGLDEALNDIQSGRYICPETNTKISEVVEPIYDYKKPAPGNEDTTGEGEQTTITYPAKGTKITNGNFIYKVTKAATAKTKGAVTLTGLSTKGKKAKTLGMTDTIKGTKGESYVVNALGSKAFSGAKAKSITLNKDIKVVPSKAFANCKRLTKLTFKAKLTKVSKNAFSGCKNKLSIKGTKAASNKKLVKKVYKKVK